MPIILYSAPYMIPLLPRYRPLLEGLGMQLIVPEVHERLDEDTLLTFAGQFDGTVCGDDHYTGRVLKACSPRLKVISKWGTGIDSIDQQAAEKLGIQVCNTPNAFTLAVADTVLGYMLTFARRFPWMDRAVKSGQWEKIPGRSLSECTLGVVGLGKIGNAGLWRAHCFGMKTLAQCINPYDQVFPTKDKTRAHIKPSAILINTSRGPVVDEQALISALQSGKLAGAALDVFEVEPLPAHNPLTKMDNVMLASHNANSSPKAWERVHQNTIDNLLAGLGLSVVKDD